MTQPGYEWLWHEPGPKILLEMLKLFGVQEVPGKKNNPTIMGWAKETHTTYPGDEVAWCGLTVSVAAKRAGYDYYPNGNALWARNWADWGVGVKVPMLGDVLVFERGAGGHVGLYVAEDDEFYHVLGGNQSNGVNIKRVKKDRLLEARRSKWKLSQPANVRRVFVSANGAPVSTSEA